MATTYTPSHRMMPGPGLWLLPLAFFTATVIAGEKAGGDTSEPPYGGDPKEDVEPSGGDPLPAGSGVVGSIQAGMEVSVSGAALYTVPIKIPPGISCMEPRLSLSYNSMAGPDIAGVGFSIGGLSTIERCAATPSRDGVLGRISLNSDDRYCLDGIRLMLTGKQKYGAEGSTYRTEGETWSRITAQGVCGDGPCSFKVQLKNGNTAIFGGENTDDCGAPAGEPETTRLSWPLTQLTDLNGNYLSVAWKSGGRLSCVPAAIQYTGNNVDKIPPLRLVEFSYSKRSDVEVTWVAGEERYIDVLLADVSTYLVDPDTQNKHLVKRYVPEYVNSIWTHRHHMSQLEECDANGECLPPTLFTWQAGDWATQTGLYDTQYVPWHFPDIDNALRLAGDFDASGKTDFIEVYDPQSSSGYGWLLRDVPGVNQPIFTGETWGTFEFDTPHPDRFDLGDFNGDGASDVLNVRWLLNGVTSEWNISLGGPDGLEDAVSYFDETDWYEKEIRVGDFDGDGRSDVLTWLPYSGAYEIHLWKGDHFETSGSGVFMPQWPAPISNGGTPKPYDDEDEYEEPEQQQPQPVFQEVGLGDFDGDGRVDILAHRSTGTSGWDSNYIEWHLFRSTGAGLSHMDDGIIPGQNNTINIADFNGDGLSDVLTVGPQSYTILHSTGRQLVPQFNVSSTMNLWLVGMCSQGPGWSEEDCYDEPISYEWGYTGDDFGFLQAVEVGNFNDDGRADILVSHTAYEPEVAQAIEDGASYLYSDADIYISDPTGLAWVASVTVNPEYPHMLGDFYGTGRTTIYLESPIQAIFRFSDFDQKPDLLVGVKDGIDGEVEVRYSAMLDATIYTRGSGATYPQRDVATTHYLVSGISEGDGLGAKYHTDYEYEGARTDLTGWGFLGFARTTAYYDGEAFLETTYRQDPPFVGVASSQLHHTAAQEETITTWDWINVPDPSAKGTFQLLRTQESVSQYGTLGVHLHTGIKAWTYDMYGNVLQETDTPDVTQPQLTLNTSTTYYNFTQTWRLGYPKQVDVFDAAQVKKTSTFYEYDGRMNPHYIARWLDTDDSWLPTFKNFDVMGRVQTSSGSDGYVTHYTYDSWGLARAVVSPTGLTEERVVDPAFGGELRSVDTAGAIVERSYDGFGRLSTISAQDPAGSLQVIQRFERVDPGVGMAVQTFTRRDWSSSTWDWKESWIDGMEREYLTRQRGEGKAAILVEKDYLERDLVWRTSQPYFEGDAPVWTVITTDSQRRPVEVTYPDLSQAQFIYDDGARKITRKDPDGATTVLYLNARGKMTERVDPAGNSTYFYYDVLSRLEAVQSVGSVTQTQWDSLDRKVSTYDTSTGNTTFSYSGTGHLQYEIDNKGQKIERTWDAMDRTTSRKIYPTGSLIPSKVIALTYDDPATTYGLGRLTSAEVWNGPDLESRYQFSYDPRGNQAATHLEVMDRVFAWSAVYDPLGAVKELRYPDGSRLRVENTSAGRLKSATLLDAISPGLGWVEQARWSGYDAAGRPAQQRSANQVVSCYQYDAMSGRLVRAAVSAYSDATDSTCADGTKPVQTYSDTTYSWDKAGRILNMFELSNPSLSQSFTFNSRGYLESAQGVYGLQSYEYDDSGNLTLKDGVAYDVFNQQVQSDSNGTHYYWDYNGNMEMRSGPSGITSYTWDPEDQLLSVDNNGSLTRYTYDFAGNRLAKEDPDGRITLYVGQHYEITVGPSGDELHTKYVPGPTGRVAQITHSGQLLAQTVYVDSLEQQAGMYTLMTAKSLAAATSLRVQSFLAGPGVMGDLVVGLLVLGGVLALLLGGRILAGVMGSVSATVTCRRVPGWAMVVPGLAFSLLVAQVLPPHVAEAMSPGASGPGVPEVGNYYLHQGYNQSTALVTSSNGALVSRVDYEPWGEVSATSPGVDHFRPKFTGAEWDNSAEVYKVGERYYDPTLGRFLRADRSLGADPLKSISLNRYAWCANNPITVTDPSGKYAIEIAIAVVALFAVAGALIGGTDGKILTDPQHAFDNWSWHRAAIGFWVGCWAGIAAYAMGTIGAGVMIFGVKASTVALAMYIGGITNIMVAYSRGETDGLKLLAYFGIGMMAGLVSTTGFGAVAEIGMAGQIFAQTAASIMSSGLKLMLDPGQPVQLQLWAVTFTFQNGKFADWSPDYLYLAGFAIGAIYRGAWVAKGALKGWNWNLGIQDHEAREWSETMYNLATSDWVSGPEASVAKAFGMIAGRSAAEMLSHDLPDLGDLNFLQPKIKSFLSDFAAAP